MQLKFNGAVDKFIILVFKGGIRDIMVIVVGNGKDPSSNLERSFLYFTYH